MPLTRRLSQELVLASVLSVVACADLTAPLADRVFATDASLARGAACSCPVPPAVCRSLWQNGDRRGAYTRLEEGPRILLILKPRVWPPRPRTSSTSRSHLLLLGLSLSCSMCLRLAAVRVSLGGPVFVKALT